jgi:Spy/CpxP family protein refolding chaperone
MLKPSRWIVLAAVAVALAVPAFLYAAAAGQGSDPAAHAAAFPDHFLHHIAGQLNLSADQQNQLKSVFAAQKDQLHTQMTQLHQARTNLANAVHADTFDEGAIRSAAAALGQAEADSAVLHAQLFAQIKQVLTPDQQAKAKALMQQHQQSMGPWSGHLHQHSAGGSANPPSQR